MNHSLLVLPLVALLLVTGCSDLDAPKKAAKPMYEAGNFNPNDPEFKKQVQARLEERQREEQVIEQASWFGTTGLSDDVERELPRYLRREFGHLLSQPNAIKASDLSYVGVFVEGVETVRYWRINYGSPEPKFAYVVIGPGERQFTGWGNRKPPT